MKKFIAKILLFIPFLFISYMLLLVAWPHFAPSYIRTNLIYEPGGYANMFSRMKEARVTKDVDILFLGASHAYRGFDPRIFKEYGYTSFNLGSSNQTPIQTKLLLDRYLNTLNPKLIVYEVHPRVFDYDGVESSLDVLANDKIDLESFKMAITLNNIKTYNTFLYAFFQQAFNRNKNFKEYIVKGDDTYISGGFVEKKLSYNLGLDKLENRRWVPLAYQINSFENILKLMSKKRIKFILLQSPVTKLKNEEYDGDNAQIDAYFFRKTPQYFNFNSLLKLDDSLHFFDSHHLNQHGVRIFNETLIKNVIINILPAHSQLRNH